MGKVWEANGEDVKSEARMRILCFIGKKVSKFLQENQERLAFNSSVLSREVMPIGSEL